jgi:hypothetical protein
VTDELDPFRAVLPVDRPAQEFLAADDVLPTSAKYPPVAPAGPRPGVDLLADIRDRFIALASEERERILALKRRVQNSSRDLCRYLDDLLAAPDKSRRQDYPFVFPFVMAMPEAVRVAAALAALWLPAEARDRACYEQTVSLAEARAAELELVYEAIRGTKWIPQLPWSVLSPLKCLEALWYDDPRTGRGGPNIPSPATLRQLPKTLERYTTIDTALRTIESNLVAELAAATPADARSSPLERILCRLEGSRRGVDWYRDPRSLRLGLIQVRRGRRQVAQLIKACSWWLDGAKPALLSRAPSQAPVLRDVAASLNAAIAKRTPDHRLGAGVTKSGLYRTAVLERTATIITGVYGIKFTAEDVRHAIRKRTQK